MNAPEPGWEWGVCDGVTEVDDVVKSFVGGLYLQSFDPKEPCNPLDGLCRLALLSGGSK